MINLKKNLVFVLILILLILISGCKGKKDVKKALEEIRTGTEGIVMSFLLNAPPDKIHAEQGTFDVVLELRNKGAFPQPEQITENAQFGKVFLSGFDNSIITITPKDGTTGNLERRKLEGKSTINPNGGQDILSFEAKIDPNNLNVEKYEPTLLATACYRYETIAGPSVCIDPNPYSTVKEKKVCEVQDTSLSNQGAPVAIAKIDEEALAFKTQFRITIKNVGNGDVIKFDSLQKCQTGGKIEREDIDKVNLDGVRIGSVDLICGPFAEGNIQGTQGIVRLVNNEGFIICTLDKTAYQNSVTAYTTPIRIALTYGYRTTAEKKIQIKKESIGVSGSTPTAPVSVPPSPFAPGETYT